MLLQNKYIHIVSIICYTNQTQGERMANLARIKTIALSGIDAVEIDVQVHIGPGLPVFKIVGLPDKSIAEARERVRAVFNTIGLNLPSKRITINMSPASLQKEGSHYDLPIAIGLLVAMGVIAQDEVENWLVIGELGLNGNLQPIPGLLMAAIFANMNNYTLVCPHACAAEAKIASDSLKILAAKNILDIINFIKGQVQMEQDFAMAIEDIEYEFDMIDVQNQFLAKRAMEIAAAGRFHMLMIGPPGIGKSMLAKRMITIMPDLTIPESLEVTMVYSAANKLNNYVVKRKRPYREPHHSASLPALVGGGQKAQPGEISLAHNGILFLDELAEYSKALDGLRQVMESGTITISRAQNHITYPARAQIIAAMNPCKCGYSGTKGGCSKGPKCAIEYQSKISGPIMDRFDIIIHMNRSNEKEYVDYGEKSCVIKQRVINARMFHEKMFGVSLEYMKVSDMKFDAEAAQLFTQFQQKKEYSMRGITKTARIGRVIANLANSEYILVPHIAEAMRYRLS